MSQPLKSLSIRVQEFLASHGHNFTVTELADSTRTAKDAANAIGCTESQIAKSLIFKDSNTEKAVLIIASGSNQVSVKKVEAAINVKLEKANANFVREKTGFAIGGVPPVAHTDSVLTIIDKDLKQYDRIWAAAGTPNSVFELKAHDLDTLTGGTWLDIAK
ncbi:YbaK/EbsC family protein [Pseudoalteromonas sp. M8]|uniref:YbaK/EbsC family protein n=1 Tax=Pseudoalteromonas sp. M8 TaxID=2692624 RepID=UPI001BA4475D|nr:YbaK/EbsC family protein [Pseudoalteromonas sp. M8]QUI71293.1 YbaK/EbsC family protein [Pseudoalteromonas sp. M8]